MPFPVTIAGRFLNLREVDPRCGQLDYVLGGGHDTRVTFGALFELALIVCNAGTAITLYPVVRKFTETVAIGYVASRLFESVMIALGVLSLLSVLTLRQDFGGAGAADPSSLAAAANALIAFHDWTFLIGPAFCAGFGNGIPAKTIFFTLDRSYQFKTSFGIAVKINHLSTIFSLQCDWLCGSTDS